MTRAASIYICGGSDGHILRSFDRLDLASNTWKALASMRGKREEHGLTIGPEGKIYAIGGFNGKSSLATCERYNPETNRWEDIASLNCARRSLSAVGLPDGVYALGGYSGEKYLSTVEKYDVVKNQWLLAQPMNHPLSTVAQHFTERHWNRHPPVGCTFPISR